MPKHDMIVIGASAGGVEALINLIGSLPEDLPAAIFLVLHIPAQSPSMLPDILNRTGHLHAVHPVDGQRIEYGHIYIAPPDHHLLVEEGIVHIARGPKENRHRPAIDPLFRSAARTYGTRVVGVILTGSLDDGTAGLLAIKRRGGKTIVQDPKDALFSSMPQSAIAHVEVDHVMPLSAIGPMLAKLAYDEAAEQGSFPISEEMEVEAKFAAMEIRNGKDGELVGTPSAFSCPECGGVLREVHDGDLLRFRCRVGHAFSVDSIMAGQTEVIEEALWTALKALEENSSFSRRLAYDAHNGGKEWLAKRFSEREQEADRNAAVIRQLLAKSGMDPVLNSSPEFVSNAEQGSPTISEDDPHTEG